MTLLCDEVPSLHWLPGAGVVELAPDVGLIGHGCWADGRMGDFLLAPDKINDYFHIDELMNIAPADRLARLNALGDDAARYLRETLPRALDAYEKVIVGGEICKRKQSGK